MASGRVPKTTRILEGIDESRAMVLCETVRMRLRLSYLLAIPATLAACDALVRLVLWASSAKEARAGGRRDVRQRAGTPVKLLVVVPSRDEGERLQTTLASTSGTDTL